MSSAVPGERHPPVCLACGVENPSSLGLRMWEEGEEVRGEVRLDSRHAGARGIAHGGAIATFLDDVMGWVVQRRDVPVVTGRLEVRYRSPALLGQRFSLRARVVGADGRRWHVTGEMVGAEGTVAEATGTWVTVDQAHFDERRDHDG